MKMDLCDRGKQEKLRQRREAGNWIAVWVSVRER